MSAIPTEVVLARLIREGPEGRASIPWTRRLVEGCASQGRWRLVRLSGDDIERCWLPAHPGEPCHGDRLVLTTEPSTVSATAESARRSTRYATESLECWSRIQRARHDQPSLIALSTFAGPHFPSESPAGQGLFHLDGFHRMVAWALDGATRVRDFSVEAFVLERA